MTKTTTPATLCAVQDHPELADLDEAGVRLWAEAHNLELHRDWRGLLCTTIQDAYRLRGILDEERQRQAEADAARRAQAEAEHEARYGRIRRRLEADARRAEMHAAVDALPIPDVPFAEERLKDWEKKADEYGRALFEKAVPQSKPDTLTAMEKLLLKGSQ